ncbi:putative Folylpolyglutamate synthase [Glarea lozoyensis 74030]|uniref:Putative Folylpolyglutamate synthase n=1 Tax=Glarea lozoyensis (strain ATCC 74030 / MF5533) TaxID=1104152 RepID=H0ETY6_GLAL7|nr:putative Folylpolyglutamate synthase [Glarea lozoyensis 74030]
MLHAGGVRCGRFTSPHLIDRWDCITVDQNPIQESVFRHAEEIVHRRNEEEQIGASEFELLTATAFEVFANEKIEMGVIEVGLGGRLDATNVLSNKAVTVISKIGLDHQSFLGNTIEEIAREKAGVMRPGVPCVVDKTNPPEVRRVIEEYAKEIGTDVVLGSTDSSFLDDLSPEDFEPHQWENLASASKGKEMEGILKPLLRSGDCVAAVKFGPVDGMPWVQAMPPEDILNTATLLGVNASQQLDAGTDVMAALGWAAVAADGGPVVTAGSLYLVSDVLRLLRDAETRKHEINIASMPVTSSTKLPERSRKPDYPQHDRTRVLRSSSLSPVKASGHGQMEKRNKGATNSSSTLKKAPEESLWMGPYLAKKSEDTNVCTPPLNDMDDGLKNPSNSDFMEYDSHISSRASRTSIGSCEAETGSSNPPSRRTSSVRPSSPKKRCASATQTLESPMKKNKALQTSVTVESRSTNSRVPVTDVEGDVELPQYHDCQEYSDETSSSSSQYSKTPYEGYLGYEIARPTGTTVMMKDHNAQSPDEERVEGCSPAPQDPNARVVIRVGRDGRDEFSLIAKDIMAAGPTADPLKQAQDASEGHWRGKQYTVFMRIRSKKLLKDRLETFRCLACHPGYTRSSMEEQRLYKQNLIYFFDKRFTNQMRVLTGSRPLGVFLRLGRDYAFRGEDGLDTGGEQGDAMVKRNVLNWSKAIGSKNSTDKIVYGGISLDGTALCDLPASALEQELRKYREGIEECIRLEQELSSGKKGKNGVSGMGISSYTGSFNA